MKKLSKKQRTKRLCIIISVCCAALVFAVYWVAGIVPPTAPDYSDIEILYENCDFETEFDSYTDIQLNGNTALCASSSVSVQDGNITIRESGVYRFQGTLTDGTIYIATGNGIVYLVFDNASVTCSTAPAVYISAADKVVITTAEETENTLSSTVSGGLESAIYSDTDVTFNGKGRMNISSENGIAVNCNTSVRFTGGEYWITAKENAVKAAHNISMCGGTVNTVTNSDSIKTSTGGKSNGKWIGVVDIGGGTLNVTSEGDGINAASVIHIGSGEVNIICSGGSDEVELNTEFGGGMQMPGMAGNKNQGENEINAKGLKADTGIYLNGGTVHIDCVDDAIHSDGDVTVDGCELYILSNNDGIQGEKRVNIRSGSVIIERSLEGICGRYVIFDGGSVDITASDDGVNATNNDNPIAAMGFEFEILGTGGRLIINGGTVNIVASADGLDSNGSVKQTGGYVTVVSKSNGVEVPIDYTGKYKMTGGTLAAFGSGGNMMQSISEDGSTVSSVMIGATVQTGNTVKIVDADGKDLYSAVSTYDATCLILASDVFSKGTKVTVYVDETEIGSAVITEGSASIGTVSGGMMGGNMGGRPNDMQGGQMPDGQTPPDMQGGQMPSGQNPPDMQDGQKPNGMQGGHMGGGMRGAFGFVMPIIIVLLLGVGITVFIIVRKKRRKSKANIEEEEDEDEDDLS